MRYLASRAVRAAQAVIRLFHLHFEWVTSGVLFTSQAVPFFFQTVQAVLISNENNI